jgi:hypothetical protein
VHDDPDSVDRGFDRLALGQVTDHVLNTVHGLVDPPTENTYIAAGTPETRNDVVPQRACATGDQDA